jgi:hypothetical protein
VSRVTELPFKSIAGFNDPCVSYLTERGNRHAHGHCDEPRSCGRNTRGTTQMNQLIASVAVAVALIGAASLARADEAGKNAKDTAQASRPRVERTTAPAGSPCVDANGSWVNWPYANVPTLSPPCAVPPPAMKK